MRTLHKLCLLTLVGVPFLTATAHAATGAVLEARHQPNGTVLSDGGTWNLGTTGVGQDFEVNLTIANAGDANLHIDTVQVAGFTTVISPEGEDVAPGATTIVRIGCDASSAAANFGTIAIQSNGSDDGVFAATLFCQVVDGPAAGALEVKDADGGTINNGGELSMDPGEWQTIWLHNVGDGQQAITLLPVGVSPAWPSVGAYVDDNVLAHGGQPVYFTLGCSDEAGAPLTGDFQVSIPMNETETSFTFTLHCGVVEVAASDADMPHTGPAGAAWSGAIAAALLAVGGGFLFVSRRRSSLV